MAGRARVRVNGIERSSIRLKMSGSDTWELDNSLVRISWVGDALRVSTWDGTDWRNKDWAVFSSSASRVTSWDQATVLRNLPEMVGIRLIKAVATGGGVYLDLMLRRGSRFVDGYIQRSVSADQLIVRLVTAEAYTSNTGYQIATAADANGQKFVAGSARSFTGHANGGVVKASTRTLDFFLGIEPSGAVAGDVAADLVQQYIAVPNEQTGVVVR